MNRKGFAPIVIALIVAAVLVVGGVWYYGSHQFAAPMAENSIIHTTSTVQATPPQPLPIKCVDKPESRAVITSLSVYSGPVGTKLEIKGCNFAGFEGDKNAVIVNAQGMQGILHGEAGSTAKVIKVTLNSPLCQEDNSYSGLPCSGSLTLTPGTYTIYITPWGEDTKSNLATFTVQ